MKELNFLKDTTINEQIGLKITYKEFDKFNRESDFILNELQEMNLSINSYLYFNPLELIYERNKFN